MQLKSLSMKDTCSRRGRGVIGKKEGHSIVGIAHKRPTVILINSTAFERGRFLNLIDSRIRRNEMEAAKGLAEELFKTEVRFALFKKTKVLARYNSLLLRVIIGLISVLVFSTALTVLNIRPAFSLVIEMFSVLGIISAVVINSSL